MAAMSGAKLAAARVFQALGDPTRRAIVERLSAAPRSVSNLAEPLGISLTAVAQHLKILRSSGLVRTEKVGRVRICCIDTAGFLFLEQWVREQRSLWERRLDRLGEALADDTDDD
jgi:DNA-binding transcriptional ArsR family regulator